MKRTLRAVLTALILLAAVTVASAAEIRDGTRIALGSERFALYSLPSDGERQVTPGRQFENGLSAYYADVDGTSYWGLMDGECRVLLQPEYTGIFPLVKEERGGEEIQNLLVLMTKDQKLQLYNARTRTLLPGEYDALTGQQTELQSGCRGDQEQDQNEQCNVVLGNMILLQSGELVGVAEQGFWRGWFTLPRVVTAGADGLPRFSPHPQLEALREQAFRCEQTALTAPWTLPDTADTAWEILIELPAQQAGTLRLQVGDCFAMELAPSSRTLRAYAKDTAEQTMHDCGALQLPPDAPVQVRIYLDRCSAEIFADGQCLSANFFDTSSQRPVSILPHDGAPQLRTLQAWQLR